MSSEQAEVSTATGPAAGESGGAADEGEKGEPPGRLAVFLLGLYHFLLPLILLLALLGLWSPISGESRQGVDDTGQQILHSWWGVGTLPQEQRLLLIALLAGGLGAAVHSATSFAYFLGDKRLCKNWVWWYVLRMPVGMAIGVLVYFVFRAGLIVSVNQSPVVNDIAVAAVSGLAGMSSKQAIARLKLVFDALFQKQEGSTGRLSG